MSRGARQSEGRYESNRKVNEDQKWSPYEVNLWFTMSQTHVQGRTRARVGGQY